MSQVNGDKPSSAFLAHLYSYPVINSSIKTIQSNPYTAKPLSLGSSITTTVSSKISPYLSTPYNYISPYVTKADSIGDSTLSTIDEKFPVVKKETADIISEGKSYLFFPVRKVDETKDYLTGTYKGEVKKVGGEGIVSYGKAAVATGFIVGGDTYNFLVSFLREKKGEAVDVAKEKSSQ